ncbi:2-hydroxy-6-oxononadienedioate/2-hydroxy-6-oxononatrienedioate hydrolase [Clarias magur]|uniref:2-hydroxy-6-oxononadienedioate/2-hydroxy-6-oxononatrienedioate hydrolase n=1 Tax=Clarias magur TaxID=1594786 RepID=A0A8J4TSA9_CLAMG|nr:2-hydroxy-6-oxononadienedioate/2-hydroxy-6-oxononatrienedioate hydrolase [Clarias magur]
MPVLTLGLVLSYEAHDEKLSQLPLVYMKCHWIFSTMFHSIITHCHTYTYLLPVLTVPTIGAGYGGRIERFTPAEIRIRTRSDQECRQERILVMTK